jgi:hypothetical protein
METVAVVSDDRMGYNAYVALDDVDRNSLHAGPDRSAHVAAGSDMH